MKKRQLIFPLSLLFLALALPFLLSAQETAESLYQEAVDAQEGENWTRAIELYTRGCREYPESSRFPQALGDLYYSRGLYRLAWGAYRQVEALEPENLELLYRLSRTAGYLNEDAASVGYLERLLALSPDHTDAIGHLGWMYYKLHRLREGEALLRDALARFGPNADFSMTLGTIYSDLFRYEDARARYQEAIDGGERVGDRVFAAVAHYNLSILETRFYRFAEALQQTGASLSSQNRASGRLAQGELFLRRLDFQRTFGEYQEAYAIDNSPLSKVNLAMAYQAAGRLEEARRYAEDCLQGKDLSWMLNYGIDPVRYRRDLHQILYDVYRGLAAVEKRLPYWGLGERLKSLVRQGQSLFRAQVHRRLFRKYSLLAARAYREGETEERLDALIQYYNAFEDYPARGVRYLERARAYEAARIPRSEPSYDLEEGRLLKRRDLLAAALERFDPVWERDMIADAYEELALAGDREAAERLFALNRGAPRQRGILLPVELVIDGGPEPARRRLRKAIFKAGFLDVFKEKEEKKEEESPRFRLSLRLEGGEARCELTDSGRGTVRIRRTFPLASFSGPALYALARSLSNAVFVEP